MISNNIKITAKGKVVCVAEPLESALLENGEVLVRNEGSIISTGTELSRVYGLKKGVVYPVYPGYASIGIVEDVNNSPDNIPQFVRGDRVLYSGPHREIQKVRFSPMSSMGMIIKLGAEFDWLNSIDATLLHLGLVAMNGILPAEVKLGDTVCVFGLGVVGLLTALLYQSAGVQVLGIDTVGNRAAHARNAGLQNVLAAEGDDQVKAVTGFFGKDVDISVDATGRSEGITNAIMCCGENGQVLLLGSPRTDYYCNITDIFSRLHMKMITLIGAFNGRYPFFKKEGSRESIQRNLISFAALIKKGSIVPGHIISHVLKPDAAMEAYDGLYNHPDTYFCVAFDWRAG
jgi:2-desacetyl-2-hydroxyethyl bacteriochlorophyllide A dehydrogenase